VLAGGQLPSESPTIAQIRTRDQTAILRTGAEAEPQGKFGDSSERQSHSAHRAAKPQDKKGDEQRATKPPSGRTKLFVGLGVAVLLLVGGFFTKQIESIAVMPFVNESGNADVEYLSDGMTGTLIGNLSQLPNLSVKARSSVFRYKGKETDVKTIGKELNVQAVLNGRVVQRGDQLTLSLELVDVATENVIWTQEYDRKQSDLVKLQSEIGRDVSNKLRTKLSGIDQAKVTKVYTADTEAYQLYLKGRFYWNKRTPESLKQAIDFYQQAIDKDANYALAYSGLAETYVLFSAYSVASAKDSMPQAKAAALRALELDETVAEAHTALGSYLNYFEMDRVGSEKEYRRAIELNPNYATAYQWLGSDNLVQRKRFDEAVVALKRAEELDPLSPIISMNLGLILVYARRFDEAIVQLNRTLSLDPNFAYGHTVLGWTFHHKGMYSEAIAEYRRSTDLTYDPMGKGFLALSLEKEGRRAEVAKLLDELKQESARRYVPSYAGALAYIGLNEKEDAFVGLEKEIEERGYWASVYAVAPELDELRDDPRFKAMLKRMNLPE
jgi:TolB-like protein/Tfp pilus assembly protein PilF